MNNMCSIVDFNFLTNPVEEPMNEDIQVDDEQDG